MGFAHRPTNRPRNAMTTRTKLISFILPAALLGVGVLQRHLMREARAEKQRLQAIVEQPPSPASSGGEESEQTLATRRDLARLRNEVRQLRAQSLDVNRLRFENEQFRSQ